ncbi:hypothetical protein ACS0TY_002510 [Phlomoides rotata]
MPGWGTNMNLITTIIGVGMSAAFMAFVCTKLIRRRLRRFEAQQTDLDLQPGHRIHGLAPLVVAAIPTVNFNREAFNNNSMENTQLSREGSNANYAKMWAYFPCILHRYMAQETIHLSSMPSFSTGNNCSDF